MTLRELRVAADMTQAQVARVLGVSRSLYSQWECGAMRVPHWVRQCLSEQFNLRVESVGGGQRRTRLDGRTMPGLFKWDEPKTDRHLRLAQMVKGDKRYIAGLMVLCTMDLAKVDKLLRAGEQARGAVADA